MHRRFRSYAAVAALIFAVGVPLACGGGGGTVVPDPVCGDGILEGTEECDGDQFGGLFCSDVNDLFVGGYLYCLPTCEIDVAHCELPVCGDDLAQGDEECDGYDMGNVADCKDHGFRCGYTTCNEEDCTINTDDCVLEVSCDTVDPILQSEAAIGGYVQGGVEYSYIYEGILDLGTTRVWKARVELWGDQMAGGLNTDPVTFTAASTAVNVFEEPHVVFLMECMNVACDPPLKFFLPRGGTLQLSSLEEAPTGTLAGTLDGITWKQVGVNWETGDASEIECGPCYDLESSFTFDATVNNPP